MTTPDEQNANQQESQQPANEQNTQSSEGTQQGESNATENSSLDQEKKQVEDESIEKDVNEKSVLQQPAPEVPGEEQPASSGTSEEAADQAPEESPVPERTASVGRIVHYFPNREERNQMGNGPLAALVVKENDGKKINLNVFQERGGITFRSDVPYSTTHSRADAVSSWDWPEIIK